MKKTVSDGPYLWVEPIPYDFRALLLHGSQSPLVIYSTITTGAVSALLLARRRRLPAAETPQAAGDHASSSSPCG